MQASKDFIIWKYFYNFFCTVTLSFTQRASFCASAKSEPYLTVKMSAYVSRVFSLLFSRLSLVFSLTSLWCDGSSSSLSFSYLLLIQTSFLHFFLYFRFLSLLSLLDFPHFSQLLTVQSQSSSCIKFA